MIGKRKKKKEEGREAGRKRFRSMKEGAEKRSIKRYESDKDRAEANKERIAQGSPEHRSGVGPVEEKHVGYGRSRYAEPMADAAIRRVEAKKSSGAYTGNVLPSGGTKKQQRKLKRITKGVGKGASAQAKKSRIRLY